MIKITVFHASLFVLQSAYTTRECNTLMESDMYWLFTIFYSRVHIYLVFKQYKWWIISVCPYLGLCFSSCEYWYALSHQKKAIIFKYYHTMLHTTGGKRLCLTRDFYATSTFTHIQYLRIRRHICIHVHCIIHHLVLN